MEICWEENVNFIREVWNGELLIANNADINARNDDGHTALQFAFATSQGIVQLLLKKANDTIASNDHLIEEYWDLWQTTLMEETARLLLSGQQVNNNEMNEYAIKQASKILMEKYDISSQRMVEIITQASIKHS